MIKLRRENEQRHKTIVMLQCPIPVDERESLHICIGGVLIEFHLL